MEKLSPGMLVVHKSGGPTMVIVSINNDKCDCRWYGGDKFHLHCFTISELERAIGA